MRGGVARKASGLMCVYLSRFENRAVLFPPSVEGIYCK